jgi:hypothetical protein
LRQSVRSGPSLRPHLWCRSRPWHLLLPSHQLHPWSRWHPSDPWHPSVPSRRSAPWHRLRPSRPEVPEVQPDRWLAVIGEAPASSELGLLLREVHKKRRHLPLRKLAEVRATRWTIEEDIQSAKGECGLDEYETRGWVGWHHHTALSMLALTFLVLQRARLGEKRVTDDRARSASSPGPPAGDSRVGRGRNPMVVPLAAGAESQRRRRPSLVITDGIDRQPDDLHAAAVELRLDRGHVAQFGRAHGGEILGMREQHHPGDD